ncbi:pentatricopeptide repeat-containing protein At1g63080, mitochondrial [Medicago truncatula]|uniref:pentatricopeptide repeat-containing protein At1g63080, mitochondrial n=1 Tax=Medicago truncatula TaxID=3880 RepID=UPI001968243E|nr:pentatricopeptide repeat-containing protein At1g63080, mitochondrial [Medicago truncatula]
MGEGPNSHGNFVLDDTLHQIAKETQLSRPLRVESPMGEGRFDDYMYFCFSYLFVMNDVDKAIALLTKFKDQGIQPSVYTYTILVKGLCRSGKLEDAQKVFEDLLVKGYNLDVYAYTVMIQGFCDKDLFDEALALLSKMEENGCIPDAKTYEIIILSLFEKDENDMAEKLLREMIVRGRAR